MKKKIIIYTGSYPYGKTTESFIGPELNVMSRYPNYDITVVPVVKDNCIREIPKSITLDNSIVNCSLWYKLKAVLGIFKHRIIAEVWKERKDICSFTYFLMALKYLYAINLVFFDVEEKGVSQERITFYAFWLSYAPVSFGIYKNMHPDNHHIFVSRGHRIEVYSTDLGVFYPMRDFLYQNIDRVYVCSEEGAMYLRNRYPYAADKITRAYLGVIENKREIERSDSEVIKIVSCSSVYQFKRVDLILSSLSAFCNKHPECNIEWTHFGGGTLYEELKDRVSLCQIPNLSIILKGSMDNKEILSYYRKEYYDLFIHLSTSEGLPVSMMEAISSSIPILATNVGGVAELVTDQTGRLLDPAFSQNEFDEALLYMIKNSRALSSSAKEFYDMNFNAELNYPKFYSEITSLKV